MYSNLKHMHRSSGAIYLQTCIGQKFKMYISSIEFEQLPLEFQLNRNLWYLKIFSLIFRIEFFFDKFVLFFLNQFNMCGVWAVLMLQQSCKGFIKDNHFFNIFFAFLLSFFFQIELEPILDFNLLIQLHRQWLQLN